MMPSPSRPARRVALLCLAGAAALALLACGGATSSAERSGNLKVVATIGMIADVARTIVGPAGEVVGLIAPGVDPHLYKPVRQDVETLLSADLILTNGLLLEGKWATSLEGARSSGRRVVALADEVIAADGLKDEDHPEQQDPHLWMDPRLWSRVIERIRDVLIEIDPQHAEGYRARALALLADVQTFDAYAERVLGTVPPLRRVLVTAHDAFGYFGRRYGYEVRGIQGLSTESEAGLKDIETLVSEIVERDVRAVFIESTISSRNVMALIEGARARDHVVQLGGQLFADAMGEAGTWRGTWLGMLDHNVATIAKALGGEVPPGGAFGKLKR